MTAFPKVVLATVLMALAVPAWAQPKGAMTGADLTALLANGLTLTLGGKGEGYTGELELAKDGTGKGSATTDAGDTINIVGTWSISGDRFCRKWADLDGGNEVCETWVLKSERSAEVFNGDARLGLNSW